MAVPSSSPPWVPRSGQAAVAGDAGSNTVAAQPTVPAEPLLVRHDSYVAWAGSLNLPDALTCWFGPARLNRPPVAT